MPLITGESPTAATEATAQQILAESAPTELVLLASVDASANNTDLFVYDAASSTASGKFISLQLTAPVAWSLTVSFQASNDNVTFVSLPAVPCAGGAFVSSTTAVGHWIIPVQARYIRVRTTAYTSGTARAFAYLNATPAPVVNHTQPVSGTVTASGVVGPAAHDAAISGNPVRIAGRALTSDYTAVATGEVADLKTTTVGALITRLNSIPELSWQYATPIASPITNTTAVAIKTAAAAGIRNYLTGLSLVNTSGVASIVTIQDNTTVIWTGYLPATTAAPVIVTFDTPLRGTAATALNFVVNTTATSTFISAQGFTAP